MSRFAFEPSRWGLRIRLFGLWIALGRYGNCFSPALHFEFPFRNGWRGRLFKITYRTGFTTETTIHIRYGQRSLNWETKEPCTHWRIDVDSDHYSRWVIRLSEKHPLLAQYKTLWEDEHGCEVETRLLGIKHRHMFL